MTYEQFTASLVTDTPPNGLSNYLQSLWFDAKNDWHRSHEIAQDIHDKNGSWIHAYLHRKEGDLSNAGYWYRKAGKPMPAYSLNKELEEMVTALLQGDK
ncbi:MAG: hypothetical protein WKF89_02815 [Chitinophagaceae bacterium]